MRSVKVQTVPEMLKDLIDLYEERNEQYKENYKRVGAIYENLFPDGVQLNTDEDFNKFALVMQLVNKLSRFCASFPEGHDDSCDDLAVYAMMAKEMNQ